MGRRKSRERKRSRSSSEEGKVKAEKNAENGGGIEWRSKDGGLSGGTRQKPHQVEVKEEPASPARNERGEEEDSIVVRHRIDSTPPRSQQRGADSPSPPRRSRRGGSSPSPVKEPSRRGRGAEEDDREKDMRRMRVEKVSSRSGARLYSQSPSPPPEAASREEDREDVRRGRREEPLGEVKLESPEQRKPNNESDQKKNPDDSSDEGDNEADDDVKK